MKTLNKYFEVSEDAEYKLYDDGVGIIIRKGTVNAYDNSRATVFGGSVYAYNNVMVKALNNGKVCAYDNSFVIALNNAKVWAYNYAKIKTSDNVLVCAYNDVKVRSLGGGYLDIYNNVKVKIWGDARVNAHDNAFVIVYYAPEVTMCGCSAKLVAYSNPEQNEKYDKSRIWLWDK